MALEMAAPNRLGLAMAPHWLRDSPCIFTNNARNYCSGTLPMFGCFLAHSVVFNPASCMDMYSFTASTKKRWLGRRQAARDMIFSVLSEAKPCHQSPSLAPMRRKSSKMHPSQPKNIKDRSNNHKMKFCDTCHTKTRFCL